LPPEVRGHFRTEVTHEGSVADGTIVTASGTNDGVDAHLADLFASD
jgi:hypothetical protein